MLKKYFNRIDYLVNDNKKYIFAVLIVFFIGIIVGNFKTSKTTENNQNLEIKKVQNSIKNNQILKNNKILKPKTDEEKILIKKQPIKGKKIISKNIKTILLYSSYSSDSKYLLELKAKEKIKTFEQKTKFVPISGKLIEGIENSTFTISFNENYLYDLANITLKIKNLKTKEISTCNGNSFNNITTEFSYYMNINIYKSLANCNIESQSDNPILNKENNLINIKNITEKSELLKDLAIENFKELIIKKF